MILIIDGNNLAHRVRHTFSLSNRGQDVSVTYGFLRTLGSMLQRFSPDSIIVCWDGGTPEYRRKILPSYKANRSRGDEGEYQDFLRQMVELSDYALPMMGVVSARKRGAEADDLMYHASRISNEESIIVTTDADLLQAVCAGVSVYSPTKDKIYNQRTISNEFGVSPATLVHMKALAGDGSDNIAGVRGIGDKTAIKLFGQYDSISGIYNACTGVNPKGKIIGKMRQRILEFGLDRICANAAVISLGFDRVGAKQAIIDAVEDFQLANKTRVKKYLMRNAFVSLIDPAFLGGISKLVKPSLYTYGIRLPVVCGRREPIVL